MQFHVKQHEGDRKRVRRNKLITASTRDEAEAKFRTDYDLGDSDVSLSFQCISGGEDDIPSPEPGEKVKEVVVPPPHPGNVDSDETADQPEKVPPSDELPELSDVPPAVPPTPEAATAPPPPDGETVDSPESTYKDPNLSDLGMEETLIELLANNGITTWDQLPSIVEEPKALKELEALDGIGKVRAEEIVEFIKAIEFQATDTVPAS